MRTSPYAQTLHHANNAVGPLRSSPATFAMKPKQFGVAGRLTTCSRL
jgi:hypothetical protein